jgi:hypothetical protein
MNDNLDRILKKVVMAYFKGVYLYMSEETEENRETPQVSHCHFHFRSLYGLKVGIINVHTKFHIVSSFATNVIR